MTRADSPMYLSTMAEATTLRNVALTLDARARARRVLPVPGGPYRSTPLGGCCNEEECDIGRKRVEVR